MGNDISRHIAEAVERWKESGAYREHNLTLSIVAREMGIPAKQLQLWLRQSAYGKFATLVTTLRVEEAKHMLRDHPDWTIDSIADYCGFNGRKYFLTSAMRHPARTCAC